MSGDTDPIKLEIRNEVARRFAAIEADEEVRFLLAIESGSRAWGFPSPDSDFDVRFIFLRRKEDYLALSPKRDVIEQPIVDEIDLAGWDLRKALGLMLNHNAVVSEWIDSPIAYMPPAPIIADLASMCERHFNPRGYARHYASLGRKSVARWGDGSGKIKIKKLFYALRPAMAVRALRLDPRARPPMNLQQLMSRCELDGGFHRQIDELIELKSHTREAGSATAMPEIAAFIAEELERAEEVVERRDDAAFYAEANSLFLRFAS